MSGNLGEPYQYLSDCPHCRTEAAVVHLMDPVCAACHLGVAAESRCRMCGWTVVAEEEPFSGCMPIAAGRCPACKAPLDEDARGGLGPCPRCGWRPRTLQTSPPRDLTSPDAARAAIERWAREEGETDPEVFAQANMSTSVDGIVRLLAEHEVVPTSFDVIAYLFPQSGAGGSPRPDARELGKRAEVVDREPEPAPPEAPSPSEPARPETPSDPRTPVRVLVSVMLADGELRRGEKRFVDAFVAREGLPPLSLADYRVWRPHELGCPPPPELRNRIVEAAVQLAHLDRERDGSEWKVITAFAHAWGIAEADLNAWNDRYDRRYQTAMTRLFRSLSTLVRIH